MDIEQNLALFQELLCCGSNIYTWRYDADGNLLSSNCPDESLFGKAFSLLGCRDRALQLGKSGGQPQVVGTSFGLIWGVDFVYQEDVLHRMYVIGPAFSYNISMQDMENGFQHYAGQDISLSWKHRLISACSRIPTAQNILFIRYLLMLHYCLTGESWRPATPPSSNLFPMRPPQLKNVTAAMYGWRSALCWTWCAPAT